MKNIKSKAKCFIFLMIFGKFLMAQTEDEFAHNNNASNSNMNIFDLSTPEIKQIQRVKLNSVKEYSGKLDLSIPLFNVKAGNISYPISLNYDSGGIKVNQEASNVGLGWSLNKIFITRKIMGSNDFEETGKTLTEAQNSPPFPSLETKMGYFKYKSQNGTLHSKLPIIDFLPDIYNVYIPTGNSTFYFEDLYNPQELTPNEIKISKTINTINFFNNLGTFSPSGGPHLSTKDIFEFTITDVNGFKYEFKEYDVASQLIHPESSGLGINLPSVSTWHITKIIDPVNNKNIEFIYEDAITQPFSVKNYFSQNRKISYASMSGYYNDDIRGTYVNNQLTKNAHYFYEKLNDFYDPSQLPDPNYSKYKLIQEFYKIKRLKKILFPEGYISFEYNFTRADVANNKQAISKISLYDYNNNLIKDFSFEYNYFNCTTEENLGNYIPTNEDCKRLKLTSIKENGLPPYEFGYIEDQLLPRKSSRAQDFLGFYNGSHLKFTANPKMIIPKLYYYPNKGAWSILPFEIDTEEYFVLKDDIHLIYPTADINRNSNYIYSKRGILNIIKYPTGGSQEFEYELNSFKIFNSTINGGGLRVKSIKLNDGKGNVQQISYQYVNENNQNSGILVRPPMYGYPQGKLFDAYYNLNPQNQDEPPGDLMTDYQGLPNWNNKKLYNTFFINDLNTMDVDINNGSHVGYSEVKKIYSDNSFERIHFTSRLDYPDSRGFGMFGHNTDLEERNGNNIDGYYGNRQYKLLHGYGEFLQTNSNYEGSIYTDFSKNRGQILKIEKFTPNNILKSKTDYTYQYLINEDVYFLKPIYSPTAYFPKEYEAGSEYVSSIIEYGIGRINYQKSRFKPVSIVQTEYLQSNSGVVEHKTIQNIDYIYQPFSKRVRSTNTIVYNNNSSDPILESWSSSKYVDDPNLPYNNTAITSLKDKNLLTTVVESKKTKNMEFSGGNVSKEIETVLYTYSLLNSIPVLSEVKKNDQKSFFKYDNLGNVIEYKNENGIPISIVWGYNNLYPIAKIEGIEYSLIPNILINNAKTASNADNDSSFGAVKENDLRVKLNAFRTNSNLIDANVLITTYTYDPLVGITSVTNPVGITGYYKYDSKGRIVTVVDENGKELKGFEYNIPNP